MKVYIYCTKAKPYLRNKNNVARKYACFEKEVMCANYLNGKIVASFDLNNVEEIENYGTCFRVGDLRNTNYVARESCLDWIDLCNYLKDKNGYAWHIDNLQVLDKPIELKHFDIIKAPQSWCYADYNDEKVIIISIKPEWVCKILNGEKTIEVRKTCPKEMIHND